MKKILYCINTFFLYSLLGFLFESILMMIAGNHFFNSGVLYGPWTFIYGIAIFFILFLDRFLKQFKLPKWIEIVLFYLGACVLMTLIEFSGGMLLEKLFHVVYWDYTNMAYNFGHYICLEVTLFWGLFATLVNYLLTPFTKRLVDKIPWYITLVFVVLFLTDVVITVLH